MKSQSTKTMTITGMTLEIQTIRSVVEWTPEQQVAIDRISDLAREIASRSASIHNAFLNFKGI